MIIQIRPQKPKGLTLLEIIISIAIFVMVAVVVSFVFNRSLFVWRASTDKNAAAQEAQTATEWLLRDIQSAKDIVTAKADEIQLVEPEDHNITYYLDNTEIRRRQDTDPDYLVAKGAMLFSLRYYDINNNELVPDPNSEFGLSGSERSRIKAVEIDITTQKNTREFRLNTVARFEPYPYYYWIKTYCLGSSITLPGSVVVIQQTQPDGGYIFAGTTDDFEDILMIKIDPLGNIQWAKTYGGGGDDEFGFLQQTDDGGYIIGGASRRWVAGKGWNWDTLLIKTDFDGNVGTYPPGHPKTGQPVPGTWAKIYPCTGKDRLYTLQQTDGGGYIIGGVANRGLNTNDYLLIKVDSTGEATWAKKYDLWADADQLYSVQQTSDGYILAGTAEVKKPGWGATYGLVIKTDGSGTIDWAKTYGYNNCGNALRAIQQTSDGYILGGTGNIAWSHGFLLVKTGFNGELTWAKVYEWPYEGTGCLQLREVLYSFDQIDDDDDGIADGYILGGSENSWIAGGGDDTWVVKTDDGGTIEWARSYSVSGSDEEDSFRSLQPNIRKGYIFAGYTQTSGDDGDNEYEFLVAKTDDSGYLGFVPPKGEKDPCCLNINDITESVNLVDRTSSIVINDVKSDITLSKSTVTAQDITITPNDVSPRTGLECPRCPKPGSPSPKPTPTAPPS